MRPADRRLSRARTAAQRSPARTAIAPTPEAEAERICFAAHPAQAFLHSVVVRWPRRVVGVGQGQILKVAGIDPAAQGGCWRHQRNKPGGLNRPYTHGWQITSNLVEGSGNYW